MNSYSILPNGATLYSPGMFDQRLNEINHVIVVAGHASFRTDRRREDESLRFGNDEPWVLQPFQAGEPPLYGQHAAAGLDLAAKDSKTSLVVMSGGFTRPESVGGLVNWSEASSYYLAARNMGWLTTRAQTRLEMVTNKRDFDARWGRGRPTLRVPLNLAQHTASGQDVLVGLNQYPRDSIENVIGDVAVHYALTGRWPEKISVMSWKFKEERFNMHAEALGIPASIFNFVGVNNPIDEELPSAMKGEARAVEQFSDDPLGVQKLGMDLPGSEYQALRTLRAQSLYGKRMSRDPLGLGNPAWGLHTKMKKHYRKTA